MYAYSKGLAVGMIAAFLAIFIWFIFQKTKGKDCIEHFDERQLYARGKAYQTGFLTLTFFICIDAFLKIFETAPYEDPLGEFTAMIIAATVFAVEAIRHDAFKGYNVKMKKYIVLYIIICFAQLINAVSSFLQGKLVENGKLTFRCISLVCLPAFTVILILMIRKSLSESRELSEEEDDMEVSDTM